MNSGKVNCLFGNIISCKTFDMQIENTSDNFPITLELNYPTSSLDIITDDFASDLASNTKIEWSKFSQEEISEKYGLYHSSRDPVRKY